MFVCGVGVLIHTCRDDEVRGIEIIQVGDI